MERMTKREFVFDQEQYDGEWPPTNAVDCLAWFKTKLAAIPPEFRDDAMIEFDSTGGYEGSHYARIQIMYARPETDEEMANRARADADRQRSLERKEREAYEQLRRKYG